MSVTFRFPISTANALGVNQAGDEKKPPEDVEADLNYRDTALEDFLSEFGATAAAGAAQTTSVKDYTGSLGNVGTGEDDLYTQTLTAALLSADGMKLVWRGGGAFVASGTATRQLRLYFGGTMIFDSGALSTASTAYWSLEAFIMRVDVTKIRYVVSLLVSGKDPIVTTSELGSLTLGTTQVVKLTGEAAGVGAATNDIVAMLGAIWTHAAA